MKKHLFWCNRWRQNVRHCLIGRLNNILCQKSNLRRKVYRKNCFLNSTQSSKSVQCVHTTLNFKIIHTFTLNYYIITPKLVDLQPLFLASVLNIQKYIQTKLKYEYLIQYFKIESLLLVAMLWTFKRSHGRHNFCDNNKFH